MKTIEDLQELLEEIGKDFPAYRILAYKKQAPVTPTTQRFRRGGYKQKPAKFGRRGWTRNDHNLVINALGNRERMSISEARTLGLQIDRTAHAVQNRIWKHVNNYPQGTLNGI